MDGVLIGGYFIPEDTAKKVIIKLLQDSRLNRKIKISFTKMIQAISLKNYQLLYKEYMSLYHNILKNPEIGIMGILNFENFSKKQSELKIYYKNSETSFISTNAKINISTINKKINQIMLSQAVSQHLFELFKTLEQRPNEQEWKQITEYVNNIRNKIKISSFRYAIYGADSFSDSINGQIVDSFVNHLGVHHLQELQNSINKENLDNSLQNIVFNKSVYLEEQSNFVPLLINGKNNTPWYKGGDLIVTQNGYVILNIQIKTSGVSGGSVGELSTTDLTNLLINLRDYLIEKNPRYDLIADKFISILKLKSSEVIGSVASQEVEDILNIIKT